MDLVSAILPFVCSLFTSMNIRLLGSRKNCKIHHHRQQNKVSKIAKTIYEAWLSHWMSKIQLKIYVADIILFW